MLADEGPDRRSAGVHAAVRPVAVRRAGPRGRRRRAGHEPVRARAGPARRGLPGREIFYRRSAERPAARRAAAAAVLRSTSPTCCASAARRAARRSGPLPVAAGAEPRQPPAAAPHEPRVHDGPRRASRGGAASSAAACGLAACCERMDAIVALSEYGARRLRDEAGIEPERVRVIPHGALDYLTRLADRRAAPARAGRRRGPGRPVLRADPPVQGCGRAARGVPRGRAAPSCGSSVGRSAWTWTSSRDAASRRGATVRFVPRFVADAEIPAYFGAPTWSSCRTATRSSRACCSPRWRSARRS